jgi:CRISPR system Cascade subunit CasA
VVTIVASFNLVDRPWVPVLVAGRPECLALRELVEQPDAVDGLDLANALAAIAVLRQVLLPVWLDALGLPEDPPAWQRRFEWPRESTTRLLDYLDEHRSRFDLFSPTAPFAQVAGLHTAKNETKPVSLLQPDQPTGNNVPLFAARTEAAPPTLSPADAALALLVAQAVDTAAIKSGAVGDPRVSAGKTTGNPTGPVGQLGVIVPVGACFQETISLNTPCSAASTDLTLGEPHWRRPPLDASWVEREASGLLDLLTWQSRRVRLLAEGHDDEVVVSRVVLTAGDRLRSLPEYEPHTAWRREDKPKAAQSPQRPLRHRPGIAVWRGLQSLLATREASSASQTSSLLLRQLAELRDLQVVSPDLRLQVLAAQVFYGNQSAVVEDVFVDLIPLPISALPEDNPVRELLVSVALQAGELQKAANHLDGHLREAAGGERTPWDRSQRLGDTLVQDLTPVVRRLLSGLQRDPEQVEAAGQAWRATARQRSLTAAAQALAAAPMRAFAGRTFHQGGREWTVRLSVAEAAFGKALNDILGPAARSDQQERADA